MEIRTLLLSWYNENHRDLPWRNTANPYYIWLSEIILQQTRVAQGTPYYHAFIDKYPTISDLAEAPEQEILTLWQGLGYYSRARNLHFAAKFILSQCGGKFPNTYEDILALRGVGEYTAAAISSFAYDLEYPVLDGNVYRVISRLFNIDTPIDTSSGKKEITAALNSVFDRENPALWNQAIMEFGALQCVPKKPKCQECILLAKCLSYQNSTVSHLPVKNGKTKVVKIQHSYLVFMHKNRTYIEKREDGIWQNLYQFPLLEKEINHTTAVEHARHLLTNKIQIEIGEKWTTEHILSHRRIVANFYTICLEVQPVFRKSNIFEIELEELGEKYPTSVLMLNYLKQKKSDD